VHSQHVHPKHPPDKEYRDDGRRDVNYPVAKCFRFTKLNMHGSRPHSGGEKAPVEVTISLLILLRSLPCPRHLRTEALCPSPFCNGPHPSLPPLCAILTRFGWSRGVTYIRVFPLQRLRQVFHYDYFGSPSWIAKTV
jgi:hypothetical protein